MDKLIPFIQKYFYWLSFPKIGITDIVEIIIITFIIYQIIIWIQKTRAWALFKGLVVLLVFTLFAMVFELNTILWIVSKTINVGIIAIFIVFQPELRRALEQLGRKNFLNLNSIFSSEDQKVKTERMSDRTIQELVKATFELARTKTGALIVLEQDVALGEYERTGISIDAVLTSQLLINIFEHNTPLHDGAVIVRNNRIVSATCYLPLTDSLEIGKELGTRHRAAIGISEVSDSLTIVVSEETGKVSLAVGGQLIRNIDGDKMKNRLTRLQKKPLDVKRFRLWKGRQKDEANNK